MNERGETCYYLRRRNSAFAPATSTPATSTPATSTPETSNPMELVP